MIITYLGKQFFKIQQGDMVLAFNPISKSSKSNKGAHFGADISLSTTNHPDYNGVEQLVHGERAPFSIDGPGDYEVKSVLIKGALSEVNITGKKYINTIYTLSIDDISIAFLGALGSGELSKEAREALGSPDVLFIPVGGGDVLDAKVASKLASSLEPKLVIPMDYDKRTLETFLKEFGEEKADTVDKLTLKPKDLIGKEADVIILKAT
jgi:hypothetical protein